MVSHGQYFTHSLHPMHISKSISTSFLCWSYSGPGRTRCTLRTLCTHPGSQLPAPSVAFSPSLKLEASSEHLPLPSLSAPSASWEERSPKWAAINRNQRKIANDPCVKLSIFPLFFLILLRTFLSPDPGILVSYATLNISFYRGSPDQ